MTTSLARRFSAAFAVACGLAVSLPAAADYGDDKYSPQMGQDGKDVIWIPTPNEMVTRMLETARVTQHDIVYDLGAGDGKIAIAAAREFGARAVGIEYNPEMAELARRNAERAGVGAKVRIITGDIFKENFSEATVVTLYLLSDLNLRLKPTLLAMTPGTRVVSHSFDMGEWEPDAHISTSDASGYFWVVPADFSGRWSIQLPGQRQPSQLELRQTYQMLKGTLTVGGRAIPIEEGRVTGREMRFAYRQPNGTQTFISLRLAGNRLVGELREQSLPVRIGGRRP